MSATIRDVSKKANVSLGTVSRYLNGYTLKESNRLRIEAAIHELGFKENIIAKGLRNNQTMTIGVIIGSLTDIFSTSIVTALERELAKENYSLVICDYEGEREKLRQKLDFLLNHSVDGIVVFPGYGRGDILRDTLDGSVPVVIMNDDIPELDADKVLLDNAGASFKAVEKLISQNHRKIAIINGPQGNSVSMDRFQGYLDAMKHHQLNVEDKYVKYGNFTGRGGYEAALELLSEKVRPTALYVTNYYMTLGAMTALNEAGVNVPGKLSMIGFDRFEVLDALNPPLTVIEQPIREMGEAAASMILKRLRQDYADFPVKLRLNASLLVRESTRRLTEETPP